MKTQRFFAFVFVVMLLVSALNTVLAQGPVPEDALLWVDLNNSVSAGSGLAARRQGRLTTDSGIDPVNEVCPQRITLEIDGNSMQVPYLGQSNATAQRAIIILYGASRTAPSYFDTMLEAAVQANGANSAASTLAPVATGLPLDTPSDSPFTPQPTLASESSAAGGSGTGCWGGEGAMVVPTLLIAALGQSRARFCSKVRKENNVRS